MGDSPLVVIQCITRCYYWDIYITNELESNSSTILNVFSLSAHLFYQAHMVGD